MARPGPALRLGSAAVGIVAIAWVTYSWWRSQCDDALKVTWVNRHVSPFAAQLAPGDYTLEVVADERRTHCRIQVKSTAKHTEENAASCTDDSVSFLRRAGQFLGFDVHGIPAVLRVQLSRDEGAPLIAETLRPVHAPMRTTRSRACLREHTILVFADARP